MSLRVLAVGAHMDDCEFGAGGTLAKHALAGDAVMILVMTRGIDTRADSMPLEAQQQRALDAAQALGATVVILGYPDQSLDTLRRFELTQDVEKVIKGLEPEVVYTHHRGDRNLDHRITYDAVVTACRPLPGSQVRAVYSFEVPSSTEWGDEAFWPTAFVDVSGEPWERKQKALRCYGDEVRDYPHPRSSVGIAALARWRGVTAGYDLAEAFELVRERR